MPKSMAAAVWLVIAAATAGPSYAFDTMALKVLGFSPDGRHFGFLQYGPQWEAERLAADVIVIDADRDRFVAGAPLRVTGKMREDSTGDNIEPQLKAFEDTVRKRAASLFGPQKIGKPGAVLATVADAYAGVYETEEGKPVPTEGAPSVTAKHPRLGEFVLKLEPKEMVWPKTSRLYAGSGAPLCSTEMDDVKGAAFRLTLTRGGQSVVLQDDKTIPASRNCAQSYGIVEVQSFDRPDGKVTLAVLLGMKSRGFEGSDRSFLAVTRVLDR